MTTWVNKLPRSPRTSSCLFATCVEIWYEERKKENVKPGKIYPLVQEQLWHQSEPSCLTHFHDQSKLPGCWENPIHICRVLFISVCNFLSITAIFKSTSCCPPDATPPSRLWSRSSRPRCPTTTWPAPPGWAVSTGSSTARDAQHHSTKGRAHTGRQRRKK